MANQRLRCREIGKAAPTSCSTTRWPRWRRFRWQKICPTARTPSKLSRSAAGISGRWSIGAWRISRTWRVTGARWLDVLLVGVAGVVVAIVAGRQVAWGAVGRAVSGAWSRLHEWTQVLLTTVLGAVYFFAAWQLMMGQDVFRRLGDGGEQIALLLAAGMFYFSPWLLLTLGAGALVTVIVFLRPSLGLMLTMFVAPLYMHPLSLLGKSFSLAELVLLPTLAGSFVRIVGAWKDGVRIRLTWRQIAPILTFVVVAIVSSLLATQRREALRELRLVVIEPVLFYLALVALPMEKRERWRVVDAFAAAAVMVAVVGLVQYFFLGDVITAEGGMRRLRSVYGSPNNVGLFLGRALPVLIGNGALRWRV